jgi:regulator of sigma E protease
MLSLGFILSVIVGLFVLIFLVVVHELGHAIAARRNGVVVEEFGIGFPPKAWGKKLKNGVLFTINWLPLGGFVKLQGEHDAASKKGDYGAASFWVKTKILLAGVMINWLTAAVIFTVLALVGLPKIIPNQFMVTSDSKLTVEPVSIDKVVEGSPAAKAGLKNDDRIVSLDGVAIDNAGLLPQLTKERAGKTVEVEYIRQNIQKVKVTLNTEQNSSKGYLGLTPRQDKASTIHATWSAPLVGIGTTAQLSWLTLEGLGKMLASLGQGLVSMLSLDDTVRTQGSKEIDGVAAGVAGPVGIIGILLPSAVNAGIVPLLLMAAILSLSLAIMNILPIPALDGGRFYTMAVFRLLKKPLTKELEEKINAIGFTILMGLVVLVTIADVGRIF